MSLGESPGPDVGGLGLGKRVVCIGLVDLGLPRCPRLEEGHAVGPGEEGEGLAVEGMVS